MVKGEGWRDVHRFEGGRIVFGEGLVREGDGRGGHLGEGGQMWNTGGLGVRTRTSVTGRVKFFMVWKTSNSKWCGPLDV